MGTRPILRDVSFQVRENEIFGIIGPANSGKTSFLRTLNRMNEFVPGMQVEGKILFNGEDVNTFKNVFALRRRIGVVFPLPVGLPLSVYDNVALSPAWPGSRRRTELDEIVERCLTPGGPLGRGEGPPRRPGEPPQRWPAAASHHCPGPFSGAGTSPPGRVLHRRGSGHHHADRGHPEGASGPR